MSETVRARFLIGYMIFRERAETCSSLWLIYSIYLLFSLVTRHTTVCHICRYVVCGHADATAHVQ